MSHLKHTLTEISVDDLDSVHGGDMVVSAIDAMGPVLGPAWGIPDWKKASCVARATTGAEIIGFGTMATSTIAGTAIGQKLKGVGGGLWGGVAGNVGGNGARSMIRSNIQNRYLATCNLSK